MSPDKALEIYQSTIRTRQIADSTRDQYIGWAKRYIEFARGKRGESIETVIADFLTSITPCSIANQKGALAALAGKKHGLYACLGKEVGELPPWVNATVPNTIPVWLTFAEAEAVISHLPDPWSLMGTLMISSGLRIGETCELRWRAFDFERLTVSIWSGKGDKCRIAPLSKRLVQPLLERRERCRGLYKEDRANKRPGVCPPDRLSLKYPRCGEEWPFFWVFPSAHESRDPESGIIRRHHIHKKSFAKPMRTAVRRAEIDKRATAHSLRHGFATAYLLAGGNLRELQERLGHTNIETTMIYLHCLPQDFDRIGSPWDMPEKASTPSENITHFRRSA